MIRSANKFTEYFYNLYKANHANIYREKSFEEIFENNKSRLEYLNKLFEEYKNNNMNHFGENVFEETIDYIVSFINGKEKESNMSIPEKYFLDKSLGAIIPSNKEMSFLLKLIETNTKMFEMIYLDNPLYIKLPNGTLNENMTRVLEIKRHNIAHLMGLTEYEDPGSNDPSKNLLKKHFYSIVKDTSVYNGNTDAERLLNWIVSKEGKEEILRIHNITLEFIEKDQKENPNSYINGNLKSDYKTMEKFKVRYKNFTGLEYPIINFSRLIIKSINVLNFMKLNNLVEVILDFNAPRGTYNEKDIFLVNRNSKKVSDKINKFMDLRTDLLITLYMYANDSKNEELKKKLLENNINVNALNIKDQLNIIKAFDFLGAYNIIPDDSIVDEKIVEAINKHFERNVNLIGFNTDFNNDIEIPLNKEVQHKAHCDTSISLTIPELIGCYYKYGRTFFLDKIDSDKGILMISNINDEIYYLKRVNDIKQDANYDLNYLIELKERLNDNYKDYSMHNERRR